jgi:hypothetical protein
LKNNHHAVSIKNLRKSPMRVTINLPKEFLTYIKNGCYGEVKEYWPNTKLQFHIYKSDDWIVFLLYYQNEKQCLHLEMKNYDTKTRPRYKKYYGILNCADKIFNFRYATFRKFKNTELSITQKFLFDNTSLYFIAENHKLVYNKIVLDENEFNNKYYYERKVGTQISKKHIYAHNLQYIGYTSYYPNSNINTILQNDRLIMLNDENGRNCVLPNGDINVWKACRAKDGIDVYVEITVPQQAHRITVLSNECISRIEFGYVVKIIDKEFNEYDEATSFITIHKPVIYRKGHLCEPNNGYDENKYHKESCGINVHKYKDQCDQWFELVKYFKKLHD